jgi:hypothetical protein
MLHGVMSQERGFFVTTVVILLFLGNKRTKAKDNLDHGVIHGYENDI